MLRGRGRVGVDGAAVGKELWLRLWLAPTPRPRARADPRPRPSARADARWLPFV